MKFSKSWLKPKWFILPISILATLLVISSAALVQDVHNIHLNIDGKANNFHLEVASSLDPNWNPNVGPWFTGGTNVAISPYLTFPDIPVGQSITAKFAVRETSTTLPGAIQVSIIDPDPTSSGSELFNQLDMQIVQNGQTITQNKANNMTNIAIGQINPGETVFFDLIVSVPQALDTSYDTLRTGIQMQIRGEST